MIPKFRWVIILVSAVPLLLAQEAGMGPGQQNGRNIREFLGLGPAPDAAAAKLGEPIYKQNCGTCHGETARGSQGPSLVRSTIVLHDEKGEELAPIIKNGRPDGGMPGFPNLSQTDVYNISQFLHLQVELAANRGLYGQTYSNVRSRTSGDPAKGQVFFQANCASCHSVTGDLQKISAKFPQAAGMQARFLWPVSRGRRPVTVVTSSGEKVTGTLSKMDDFTVSMRDSEGQYREWPLDRVKVQMEDKLTGHRNLLPKYTDADIHNITAYLLTLK